MNTSLKLYLEHSAIGLLGIIFFLLFGFSVTYLPEVFPPSLDFLAYASTIASSIATLLVILSSCGIGSISKRRDKAAIEVDNIKREKYAKTKQPWER